LGGNVAYVVVAMNLLEEAELMVEVATGCVRAVVFLVELSEVL
jgi:hypothetical protein